MSETAFSLDEAEFVESPHAEARKRVLEEFCPGAKLLCVDDSNLNRNYDPEAPKQGHLYCVRELYHDSGRPGVLLVGIVGPRGGDGLECGFYLSRFRWAHS